MKKILKVVALLLALLVALSYVFGYQYLFKGVAKTYLRGETSATLDDGNLFPSNLVIAGSPKTWEKDSQYNKKKLPAVLLQNLKETNTNSLIIVKNGKLVHEEYWNGGVQHTQTNSFSMAKGISVLLLGMAIQDGKIKSLDQKYSDFYENYAHVPYGKNLSLRNLAAMEAGLDWDEKYKSPFSPNAKAYYGNSLAEAVFLRGFTHEPGTKYEYQSGATQLLGFALRKAVDQPLAEYLSKKLWTPLGMEGSARWTTDENDMEKTFCCIHAESRDFAKIGQLMLDSGKVGGKPLIDKNFITQMTTPSQKSGNIYGLGLWINNDNPVNYYLFWGLLGQYIIVIPEKQMVIVRTGSYDNESKTDRGRPAQAKLIVNEVSSIF